MTATAAPAPNAKEISASLDGRDITRGWLEPLQLAPIEDPILREYGGGDLRLYEEILRDDTARAAINQRNHAVVAAPWQVESAGPRAIDKAAAAGQWDRMQRHRRTHPYARYVSMDDGRVRPLHRAWHGVVLPLDDAWWDTHRPPNGWRCRCRVVGVTQREYDAGHYKERPGAQDDTAASLVERPMKKGRPKADGDTVEWQNPQTGEVQQVPRGIDPGFAYNGGTPAARSEAFNALVQRKLEAMEPKVRAEAVKAGWYPPGINKPQLEAWRAMAAKMVDKEHGTGQTLQVHTLDTDTAQAMQKQGITLQDRAVWVKDSDLAHALRDTKADRSADIPDWVWRDLPVLLQGATPYLDTEKTALVYGLDLGERWGKVVVQVNYSSKGRFEGVRATKVSNFMSTGGLIEPENLEKAHRYLKLVG